MMTHPIPNRSFSSFQFRRPWVCTKQDVVHLSSAVWAKEDQDDRIFSTLSSKCLRMFCVFCGLGIPIWVQSGIRNFRPLWDNRFVFQSSRLSWANLEAYRIRIPGASACKVLSTNHQNTAGFADRGNLWKFHKECSIKWWLFARSDTFHRRESFFQEGTTPRICSFVWIYDWFMNLREYKGKPQENLTFFSSQKNCKPRKVETPQVLLWNIIYIKYHLNFNHISIRKKGPCRIFIATKKCLVNDR